MFSEKEKLISENLGESKIYEGRVSRYEIERRINVFDSIDSVSSTIASKLTKEEIGNAIQLIECRLSRVMDCIDKTYMKWRWAGFSTSPQSLFSSHATAGLDKLFLREAGALSRDFTVSTRTEDILRDQEKAIKESERQQEYTKSYRTVSDDLENMYEELTSFIANLLEKWDKVTKEEKTCLVEELKNGSLVLYNSMVDVIMMFLPGRTFLNAL